MASKYKSKTLVLIIGGITLATGLIIFVTFRLIEVLEENSKKMHMMKASDQESHLVGLVGIVDDELDRMATEHPVCESLFQEAEARFNRKQYKECIDLYGRSWEAYLADLKGRPLNKQDRTHWAVRLNGIAKSYQALGDVDHASEYANRAIFADPMNPFSYKLRASAYEAQGKPELARRDRIRSQALERGSWVQ